MTLQLFLETLTKIKRTSWNKGWSPHKPILLLSLIDWCDKNHPTDNYFPFDEDLVRLFKENWQLLVPNVDYKPDLITKPFFYLKNDGFWFPFHTNGELHGAELRSIKRHYETKSAARFSDDVFQLLQSLPARELLRMKLLDTFFSYTKQRYIYQKGMDGLILDIEADVLMEPNPAPRYGRRVIDKTWEGYIREQKFAVHLLHAYNNTCSISGLWVADATMVDACHIKPHHLCGINSLDNGLALCPNLHRAFDAGLLSLTDDYHVIVKDNLSEADTDYGLKRLAGRKILLPKERRFWPGREWVRWQRESFEKI